MFILENFKHDLICHFTVKERADTVKVSAFICKGRLKKYMKKHFMASEIDCN